MKAHTRLHEQIAQQHEEQNYLADYNEESSGASRLLEIRERHAEDCKSNREQDTEQKRGRERQHHEQQQIGPAPGDTDIFGNRHGRRNRKLGFGWRACLRHLADVQQRRLGRGQTAV